MTYEVKLRSPVGNEEISYTWLDKIDCTAEVIETIRLVCEDHPELKRTLESELMLANNIKSFEGVTRLAYEYNKHVKHLLKPDKEKNSGQLLPKASREQLCHILQQVYNHTVTDPEKLNQYTPFSPEVYGETSYDLICQVVDNVSFTECDTFIDLGSGIGQVVLQIAASTPCKFAWGIERAEWPSHYAENVDRQFKRLMKWWGKRYGEYKLIKGDFLDPIHSEKLKSATVIFVNNFAFGPALDNQLIERFNDAMEGTRIISPKAFCPLNFRITPRTLCNVGCIMNVSELPPIKGSVSWTGNAVSYYLHVIDRKKLHSYFEKQKNLAIKRMNGKKEYQNPKESPNSPMAHKIGPAASLAATFDSSEVSLTPTREKICSALDVLLDRQRVQMIAQLGEFGEAEYLQCINSGIQYQETIRDKRQMKVQQLEKEVDQLTSECMALLQHRMAGVSFQYGSPADFSRTAAEVCSRITGLEQNSQLEEEWETAKIQGSCQESEKLLLNGENLISLQAKDKFMFSVRASIHQQRERISKTMDGYSKLETNVNSETQLKSMMTCLLDEGVIEPTVRTLTIPIDEVTVQIHEQQPRRMLNLTRLLPAEQLYCPQTTNL